MQKAKPELETEGLCNRAVTAHLGHKLQFLVHTSSYLCLCLLISKAELQFHTILADTFGGFWCLRDMPWYQHGLWLCLWLRNNLPSQGVDRTQQCVCSASQSDLLCPPSSFSCWWKTQGWSHLEPLEKPGTQWWPPGFWSQGYREPKAHKDPTETEILAAYEGVGAASEAVSGEAQLLLATQGWIICSQHWSASSLTCSHSPLPSLHQTHYYF